MDLKFGHLGNITNKLGKLSLIALLFIIVIQIVYPIFTAGWATYLIFQTLAMWIAFTIGTFLFYDAEDDDFDREDSKYFLIAAVILLIPYVCLAGAIILLILMIRDVVFDNDDKAFEKLKECIQFKYWYPRNIQKELKDESEQ